MHNKNIKKLKAFTLAEMMVILTVMSVVMAATIPIMTAKQGIIGDSSSTLGTGSGEKWFENKSFDSISYHKAVGINYQATITASDSSYTKLYVKNNYMSAADSVGKYSQVMLLHKIGSNTYEAAKMVMGYTNIGIGSHAYESALTDAQSTGNVALGTYSLHATGQYPVFKLSNVAIGRYAIFGDEFSIMDQNVAIGAGALKHGAIMRRAVAIGYSAGGGVINKVTDDLVAIGKYASFSNFETNNKNIGNVNIGLYSSMRKLENKGHNQAVSLGAYIDIKNDSEHGVYIGYGSTATDTSTSQSRTVSIGSNHKFIKYSMEDVFIGNKATTNHPSTTNNSVNSFMQNVYIGRNDKDVKLTSKSPYNVPSRSVAIGHYSAGPIDGGVYIDSNTEAPSNFGMEYNTNNSGSVIVTNSGSYKGAKNDYSSFLEESVIIGKGAGVGAHLRDNARNSICLGSYTCVNRTTSQPAFSIGSYADWGMSSSTAAIIHNNNNKVNILSDISGYANILGGSTTYSNFIIAPTINKSSPYNGRIILYASKVYGPATTMVNVSDRRLKTNIKPAKESLKEVRKLNVYEYNMKADSTKTRTIGVIAQELKKIIPNAVEKNPETGYYSVDASWIVYAMVNAVKELDKKVETIKKGIFAYTKEYNALLVRVTELEKQVKQLEKENRVLANDINKTYKKAKALEKVNK